jgi:tetratricopeptide (TPR) repeat protein
MRLAIALLLAVTLPSTLVASPRKVSELLEQWQLEDAMAVAQEDLMEDPESPEALLSAARVQHARGRHLSALTLIEATRDAGTDTGYFGELVEHSARYAAKFKYKETKHFRIAYLNKDEIVADYAAPVLEAAYRNIGAALEFLPAERGEKIAVEIYPDARGLAGATGLTVAEIETSGTIAVCKFHRLMITSPLATAGGYSWADTIAHEYTHLVISKKSRNNIPIWLHEGIAKYYESLWDGDAGRALSPYAEKLLAKATRNKEFITFEQMHPSMAKLPSQDDAALAFAEVFTVIEYLRSRFGPQSVAKVLEQTGEGEQLESALSKTFGMNLKRIESTWQRALQKRKFKEHAGAKPRKIRLAKESESNQERPLEEIAEKKVHDHSRLGELLALRNHHEAAAKEYEKAYARAGLKYITLAYRLARSYDAINRTQDAIDVLNKALHAHPGDGDARLLAGRIHFKAGQLEESKAHYEKARLHNPFNPEIHRNLAKIYDSEGQQELSDREKHYLELSSKTRPTRVYDLPARGTGNAALHIFPANWGLARINGEALVQTPAWNIPVSSGTVTIEHLVRGKNSDVKTFDISADERRTVILR